MRDRIQKKKRIDLTDLSGSHCPFGSSGIPQFSIPSIGFGVSAVKSLFFNAVASDICCIGCCDGG